MHIPSVLSRFQGTGEFTGCHLNINKMVYSWIDYNLTPITNLKIWTWGFISRSTKTPILSKQKILSSINWDSGTLRTQTTFSDIVETFCSKFNVFSWFSKLSCYKLSSVPHDADSKCARKYWSWRMASNGGSNVRIKHHYFWTGERVLRFFCQLQSQLHGNLVISKITSSAARGWN